MQPSQLRHRQALERHLKLSPPSLNKNMAKVIVLFHQTGLYTKTIQIPSKETLIQKGRECKLYLLGVKKWFWYLIGCPASKGPEGAFGNCVEKRKFDRSNVLFSIRIVTLRGEKNNSHKPGSLYLLGDLCKISNVLFI